MGDMRILLVPDPTSPNGEDAFCREIGKRAPARGHETWVQVIPNAPLEDAVDKLTAMGFAMAADAVVINSLQPAALLAAKAAGKKAVVRIVDSYAGASEAALGRVRDLLLKADLILVPSRHLADLVTSWGAENVRHVPYAYDRIMAQQIALVTIRAARPQGMSLVASAPLNEATRPGFETLFNALQHLRFDAHLTVVGVGPALHALQDRAQQLMVSDKVTFLGALPHPKLMEFVRAAKAFVDPCGIEGFPTLSLHALSEGCPVVAARTPGVCELIDDQRNGLLFTPGDPRTLSEALTTLWSVRGLSLQLIDAGIKTVASLSWDATVDKTLTAVEGLNEPERAK